MDEPTVVRWRRYGKDRLYIVAVDGTKIGWHDLLTGEDHVDAAQHVDLYRAAVAAWKGGAAVAAMGPLSDVPEVAISEQVIDVVKADPPPEVGWEDLALRRAGALAREQALSLKQAAPVRTFVARVLGVRTAERARRIGADGVIAKASLAMLGVISGCLAALRLIVLLGSERWWPLPVVCLAAFGIGCRPIESARYLASAFVGGVGAASAMFALSLGGVLPR